jgi:uncharacterized protein YndB with AHSA1/START domain
MSFVPLGRISRSSAPWSLRRTELIAASPARTWRALVEPAELSRWWADWAEVDPRPGGRYAFGGPHVPGGGARVPAGAGEAGFEITAFEPGTRLEFRWPLGGVSTQVSYEIANVLESTEVIVTQEADRAPPGSPPRGAPDWWCVALPSLRSFVEKGRPDLRIDFEAGGASPEIAFAAGVTTFPWVIWQKLTDPRELERWWARRAGVDLRPGGDFRLGLEEGGPETAIEVDEGRRLVHDWAWPGGARGRVEWTIEETDEDTRVSVRDLGPWDPAQGREALLVRWAATLLDLKQMSERGVAPREYQNG